MTIDGRVWARRLLACAIAAVAGHAAADAPALAASRFSSYALDGEGRLYAWGFDYKGKLGLGKTLQAATRQRVGSDFVEVAAGDDTSFARSADGAWWAWGSNRFSQLGDGSDVDRATPVRVAGNFVRVAPGLYHTLALDATGALWGWGENSLGELGGGTKSGVQATPLRIGGTYLSIAAGWGRGYGVKSDGTLWQWGGRSPTPVLLGSGYVAVSAGGWHALALKADGSLWSWGFSFFGEVGDGDSSTTERIEPVQVGSNFRWAFASMNNSFAIKSDGTLWAWGWNANGQLGDGTTTNRTRPVLIGAGFAEVSGGRNHTVARKTDGTIWAWGDNRFEAFGNGGSTSSLMPMLVGSGYRDVAAGWTHSLVIDELGVLWSAGSDEYGALGVFARGQSWTHPQLVASGIAAVSAAQDSALAVGIDGALWAWGNNESGQLGDGTRTTRSTPVVVGRDFRSASISFSHSVGIKRDGTLWAWGYNGFKQIGDGSATDRLAPVMVGSGWQSAAAGVGHTLGVKTDGTLWIWGTPVGRPASAVPTQIGTGYRSVHASGSSFAIKADGSLWAWGPNQSGQLGDGTTTARTLPVQVGTGFVDIAASPTTPSGLARTLGLKSDGTLWAWGTAGYESLGDGRTYFSPVPVQIGEGYRAIALAGTHGLAMKADGSVQSWGSSRYGELGNGSFAGSPQPLEVIDGSATRPFDLLPAIGPPPTGTLLYYLALQKSGSELEAVLTDLRARGLLGEVYFTALLPSNLALSASTCRTPGCDARAKALAAPRSAGGVMVAGSIGRGGFKQTGATGYVLAESAYDGVLENSGRLAVVNDEVLSDSTAVICMGVTVPELSAKGQVLMRPIAVGTAVQGIVQCPPVQTAATIAQFRSEASGPISARTITAVINPLAEERGKTLKVFSWAVAPDGRQFMQTGPNRWELMTEPMQPTATITVPSSGPHRLEVTRNLDLTGLEGTLVFIGLGQNWEEVRNLNKAGHHYTVQ